MIPTMIVFGLLLGRWWKTALIAAAIFWPALLLVTDVLQNPPAGQSLVTSTLLAAGLGALNAAVGVGVHQLVLYVVRRFRRTTSDASA